MRNSKPVFRDLLLVGGGHTHALVLQKWAMNPMPGVRVTVVSPDVFTPYSGMLPGLIAGIYQYEDIHIDLFRLCKAAGARFIRGSVEAIDSGRNRVCVTGHTELEYDVVSIDVGATPSTKVLEGSDRIIPVKPIASFWQRFEQFSRQVRENQKEVSVAVVGGGAGGVELCCALIEAMRHQSLKNLSLLTSASQVLENYPMKLRSIVEHYLSENSVDVRKNFKVAKVEPGQVLSDASEPVVADIVFWCTAASAPDWPRVCGLEVDDDGFVRVGPTLQSTSSANVFACGDVAHFVEQPLPKAGVYAVRQAPVLFENLRAYLCGKPLKRYRPQKDFLSLLALGKNMAVGSRSGISFSGAWVWRWKDAIDRKFMSMFTGLSLADMSGENQKIPAELTDPEEKQQLGELDLRCGGCGAKVARPVLEKVLDRLELDAEVGVAKCGLHARDDAAVIAFDAGVQVVQSVDQLRLFVDDLYLFGKIAANHALSDLFAMNARPHSALAIVSMPYSAERIVERDMYQMLSGAQSVFAKHGSELLGGHSAESDNYQLGFSVNGVPGKGGLMYASGVNPGDHLVLSRPLGTGVLFAADMRGQADSNDIVSAITAMLMDNGVAGRIFAEYGANACTDVTGFGLLGHLYSMLRHQGHGAEISLDKLPVLSGAVGCFSKGIQSSLHQSNAQLGSVLANRDNFVDHHLYPLLFDPQTAGGLLASVPAVNSDTCVQKLRESGHEYAKVIGRVTETNETNAVQVRLR